MNVLIIGEDFTKVIIGGTVIRKRNFSALSQIAESVYFFPLLDNYGNFQRFFTHFLGKYFIYNKKINRFIFEHYNNSCPTLLFLDGVTQKTFSIDKIKKKYPQISIIVFFHNCESDHFIQYILTKIPFCKKLFQKYVTLQRIRKTESYYCSKADKLITLNNRDSQSLNKYYGRAADFIWPTTFSDSFSPDNAKYTNDQYILFIGSDFYGNTDGLFWFIKNCMPHIHIPLKIIGYGMEKYASEYNSSNVEFIGCVDNLAPYITDSTAIVLPIISGSGMKTKTCECLMYGKKIFGTTEAFIGYDKINETSCSCCNTADDFVSKINSFLNTINECQNIPNSYKYLPDVRQYFLENYEQKIQEERFNDFLEQVIHESSPSAVFCILARDCEKNIDNNIKMIEKYRSNFSKSTVIVIENDSIDLTKDKLQNWAQKSNDIILKSQNHPEWKNLDRIERIAKCRNLYMEELRSLKQNYNYVIVLDMDVELQDVNLFEIINKAPKNFSALTANGRYYFELFGKKIPVKYYDLYAYVPYKSKLIEFKQSELQKNGDKIESLIRKSNYIMCDSAFGGLAIYKYKALKNLNYKLIANNRSTFFSSVCEHVPFNKSCLNAGNIYIAKDLKLLYDEKNSWKDFVIVLIRLIFKSNITDKLLAVYFMLFKRKRYDTQKD